jgi:hypothetical protein
MPKKEKETTNKKEKDGEEGRQEERDRRILC